MSDNTRVFTVWVKVVCNSFFKIKFLPLAWKAGMSQSSMAGWNGRAGGRGENFHVSDKGRNKLKFIIKFNCFKTHLKQTLYLHLAFLIYYGYAL